MVTFGKFTTFEYDAAGDSKNKSIPWVVGLPISTTTRAVGRFESTAKIAGRPMSTTMPDRRRAASTRTAPASRKATTLWAAEP